MTYRRTTNFYSLFVFIRMDEALQPISEKKQPLNVVAFTDFSEYGDTAIEHAVCLARIFSARLTILPLTKGELDVRAKEALANVAADSLTYLPPFVRLEKEFPQYAEENNVVLVVMATAKERGKTRFSLKKTMKLLRQWRMPTVVVGNIPPSADAYSRVVVAVDNQKYVKETMLWAGYFSRFCRAAITLLVAHYADEYRQKQVEKNLAFAERVYSNLEINTFRTEVSGDEVTPLNEQGLQKAKQENHNLLLLMTTKFPSVIDFLFGRSEDAIVAAANGLPVMCINRRDDLYVLCV